MIFQALQEEKERPRIGPVVPEIQGGGDKPAFPDLHGVIPVGSRFGRRVVSEGSGSRLHTCTFFLFLLVRASTFASVTGLDVEMGLAAFGEVLASFLFLGGFVVPSGL